jgi:hypothetical protein
MRILQPMAGGLLALVLAACGGEREAAASIPRERFVAANVAMRSVPDSAPNAQALRAQALQKHKVSEKELKQFVRAYSRDPEFMAGVWRDISNKVDSAWESTRPRDAPPTAGAPPAPDDAIPGERPAGIAEVMRGAAEGRMPSPPPVSRPGQPIIIGERPSAAPTPPPGQPAPPRADTTRRQVPIKRRISDDPPADTRPWVPGDDSMKLRIPPRQP